MSDLRLRHRHRLRAKEARRFNDALEGAFGVRPLDEGGVDRAEAGEMDVLIQGGTVVAMLLEGEGEDGGDRCVLSVRGLLANPPTRGHVTVDMGAVPHVTNGADVMAPGIVDADPDVAPGDLVWVRDERNEQPLAVGEALVTGGEMVEAGSGRSVRALHHVGDDLWKLEV